MIRTSTRNRFLALAVAAALALALSLPSLAKDGNEIVQFKIVSEKDNATIEIPLAVLQFLSDHQVGRKLDAGKFNGQRMQLDLDQILKSLPKSGEMMLFQVEEAGKKTTCNMTVVKDAALRPGKEPVNVVLTADEPNKAGPAKITVPLATIEALFTAVKVDDPEKDDLMPLVRDLLPFARQLGTGLLARIQSKGGQVTLMLE
jgi:hypothetical protein